MSVLKGFLQPTPAGETKDVVISKRFVGEDGKPLPFKIKIIDQDTNDRIVRAATKTYTKKGQSFRELDPQDYGRRLILACVASPDFQDKEMCDYYKCIDPLSVPGKMLSSGEYQRLMEEINKFNGFGESELSDLSEEAKNS